MKRLGENDYLNNGVCLFQEIIYQVNDFELGEFLSFKGFLVVIRDILVIIVIEIVVSEYKCCFLCSINVFISNGFFRFLGQYGNEVLRKDIGFIK